jgi:hypothetical protein
VKRPAAEKKKTTETAEVLAANGLKTYIRSDGAVMVEITPHSYLNAELLALAHGRGRVTGQ